MTLIEGKVKVLRDDMSMAPHVLNEDIKAIDIANLEVLNIEVTSNMSQNTKKDQLFGPFMPH